MSWSALNRRGVALMLVLWMIIVVGAIAAGVAATVREQSGLIGTVQSRSVARYAAESGVIVAREAILEALRRSDTPEAEARVFTRLADLIPSGEQALGDARFQIAVADLNARIDLNQSEEPVLRGLFRELFGEAKAESLVDALQDWKDRDEDWKDRDDAPRPQGAEAEDYLAAGTPFVPPNQPLLRLDELTRIRGFSDSVAAVLAPYVTVHGDGRVNVNTAPREVLAALPELGPTGADLFISTREGAGTFESLYGVRRLIFESVGRLGFQSTRLTTVPVRLLVVSRGWRQGDPLTHEIQAVFDVEGVGGATGLRLEVRYWTERDL